MLDDPAKADATLTALGEDFSKLPLEDMRIVVQETKFYGTAEQGVRLFQSPSFKDIMSSAVVPTCQKIEILRDKVPTVGYNETDKQLNFSTKYMEAAQKTEK